MEKASWYTGILNGMTGALGKFVSIFKKHGFVYVTLVLILFVSCYTLIINPIRIDKLVEKRIENMYAADKQREAESISKRLQADDIIGSIMTKIVDKFPEVNRILLLESHNSIRATTGTDLLYFSATMEMLTPNSQHFQYLSEDLQKQIRRNLFGSILNTLKYRDYMYYESVANCNHPDHRIIQKLKAAGDKEALLIPFIDKDGMIQIVMIVSGENMPVADIMEYINSFKKQIEACLM